MPGTSGLELLQSVKQKYPNLPVIIKADSGLQYQRVIDVLDLVNRLEISQLGLVTQRVVNWTYSDNLIRLEVKFGANYSSDPRKVQAAAIAAAVTTAVTTAVPTQATAIASAVTTQVATAVPSQSTAVTSAVQTASTTTTTQTTQTTQTTTNTTTTTDTTPAIPPQTQAVSG